MPLSSPLRLPLRLGLTALAARRGGVPDPAPPVNVSLPSIMGTPAVGSEVTANQGGWSGYPSISYAYQWRRDGVNISGATAQTYTIQAADYEADLDVVVSATNTEGGPVTATSPAVTVIGVAPVNTVAPVVSGGSGLGDVLTTTNGTWTGYPASFSYAYQWQRNGSNISGATASTYTIVAGDSAASITCLVTATNAQGSTAQASNGITVQTFTAPVISGVPTISGTAEVGQLLTATAASVTGNPSPSRTWQWLRDGSNISGATSSTYTLVSADGGTDVSVRQTETNALGADDAESSAVSVAASPDVYPLDEIATQPLFAYGAYKLRSAYSGPALRVVRPSDSATQDIGFSGANLDTSALDSFLAGQTGEIDIWYDQTGNGHNATQATSSLRPLIDSSGVAGGPILSAGKRAIILNGDTLAIPETVSLQRRAATIYCVTEQLFSAGTQSALFQLGSGSNQTSVFMVANTTGGRLIQLNSGGNSTFRTQQRPLIYESRYRTTAATTSQGSEVASFGAPADVAMAGGFVGNTALAGGYQGKFYATAFIAYASDLPDIDRTAVRSSLNTNHAITENPTDRVIYVGDSITVVSSTASPNHYGYPKMADAINGHSYHSYNVAGGGQRIEIQLSQYANQVGNILSAYSDNRVVVIAYGTNDISQGRTAAQIRADVESYCASIRGSGSKVVVGTILPATGHTSPMQTERDTYNAGIRADWATFADGLMDFAADPTMGPQAAASNTSLYPDGLHPSRLGHTYLAPIAAAAIASAL